MATSFPFNDKQPGPEIREKLNELYAVWEGAISNIFKGDKGWSPLLRTVADGERQVIELYGWAGGEGVKPAQVGYLGVAGYVSSISDAVDFKGSQGLQGVKGLPGEKGAQGIQGVKGDTGDQGAQGIQGVKGDTGDQGAQGIQGVKGDTGDVGPQGIQGVKGDTGDVGPQGIQGVKGDTGDVGAQGIQGVKGDTGDVGPQGAQGIQGVKGDTGDVGPQGAQGIQGVKGDTGAGLKIKGSLASIGELPASGNAEGDAYLIAQHVWVWSGTAWVDAGPIQGEKGDTGLQGPQGLQGIQGDTGPQGATGATGAAGGAGSQGAAATIAVGTTTTGAAGTSASVVNAGTSSAAVFNFTIPRGATGDTGPIGATGQGIAAGGTTGQALLKNSATSYDAAWGDVLTPAGFQELTNKTLNLQNNNVTIDGTQAIGYLNIPQIAKSAAYTLVIADAGKHLLHPSADTTARVFTIPSNTAVSFPLGTAITFVNQSGAGVVTISINTDVMRLAGAGTTGSRTLAANGIATAIKITATEWIISGVGLT